MEEASVGKITRKFTLKTLLWFVIIDIVIGFIFLIAKVSGFENIADDEAVDALNGLVTGLIVVNILAAICSPLLALRGTKKKCKITSENKKPVFRNIAIVLVVFAIIMGILHGIIKNQIFEMALEGSDISLDDIKEARKDLDEYIKEENLSKADQEILEQFDGLMGLSNVYVFDCITFLVMIPVAYFLVVKKEEA
mgnify:FL=1